MKESTRSVYKCDYCGRNYLSKGFAEKHEKSCINNPDNYRPCLSGCIYLDKKDETIYEDTPNGEQSRVVRLLHCTKFNVFLYPPKVEHKGNWIETDSIPNKPMPRECGDIKLNYVYS